MIKNDGFAILKNIFNDNLVIPPIFEYMVNSGTFFNGDKITNLK
jgi:hypothetical protein